MALGTERHSRTRHNVRDRAELSLAHFVLRTPAMDELCKWGAGVVWAVLVAACGHESEPGTATDLAGSMLPEDAGAFLVSYGASRCYGSCPELATTLDHTGHVAYFGGQCAARAGAFTREVGASAARSFYQQLLASPFRRLHAQYLTAADGCTSSSVDGPGYTWSVTADGARKDVRFSPGCRGFAELRALGELASAFATSTGTSAWSAATSLQCDYQIGPLRDVRFAVSFGGAPLGLLQLQAGSDSFVWTSCTGEPLVTGAVIRDTQTYALQRVVLVDAQHGPLRLPGALGTAGSLVLAMPKAADGALPTSAEVLRDDGSVTLALAPADACPP
ncbi:MAG: hypothetical protein RL385_1897 [Pseudomonadota bacterium]|jgi:hypothetical protein